ncbi:High-affinity zinc uptake system binding-protein ZnuA precursor [Streptomyces sp. S4.7]|uniref:metal ABC transporter substrate-binding protein n=1 Tax=Streptomyces sp. S4.7 TaxID=2705439 RepID=UPI001397DEAD|nr:metal ABC transporter substrate-binding protein [Streptomyces sp. S4.7]QHY95393.1 High-affinity zinc uptake system binding-protein ZnuA precursor [Streptomyces sp. S4.7]
MNVRRLIPTAALAGSVTLALVALSACSPSDAADGGGGAGGKGDGKLAVIASFYPMQYLAEEIGGTHVDVSTLTRPGVEPHDLELGTRQAAQLGDADYILYLKGLQPAVDEAIGAAGVKNTVDAATLTELEKHGSEVGHSHGDEHAGEEHAEDGHAEEHADEEHADEGEAGTDPHIWLDPVKYAEVAKGVGASLEKADPDNADAYRKNTTALVERLTTLDTAFEKGLADTSTKTFITTHSAFGYLAERYGLKQESISGLSPESEPSPARIKELRSIAAQDKVGTVFFETLVSDRTAKTVAADSGLKTDVLDPIEGITKKSKGADYVEVMESNLAALEKALGTK